jgi:hypothetical protein
MLVADLKSNIEPDRYVDEIKVIAGMSFSYYFSHNDINLFTGQKYEYLAISLRSKKAKNLAHHISRFTKDIFQLQLLLEETITTSGFDWGTSRRTSDFRVDEKGKMSFKDAPKVYT